MSTSDRARQVTWFQRLDKLFWLAWLGLAVMIWSAYADAANPEAIAARLPPEQALCANLLPNPGKMSGGGQILFWGLFALQISIYVVLLGALHLLVNRFARGRIFVAETLATLGWLGAILVVWPFLDTAATQLIAMTLKARGDLSTYVPSYSIDVAPAAIGLFLMALRHVLKHANEIKSEHDLTI